jgi:hypothetical protein
MIQFMIPSDAVNHDEMAHIKFLGIQDAKVKTYLDILEAIAEIPVESKLELETNVIDALSEIVSRMRK